MIVQKFNHSVVFELLAPVISWHINHRTEQFQEQVGMFFRLLCKIDVAFHELLQCLERIRIELGDVAAHFEEQGISILEGPQDQLFMLVVLRHYFSVSRVSCQIDGKGD